MNLPALDDLLGTLRVVTLPLLTRFRGVDHREAALFEGPEGWAEFSPFLEYDTAEAATWLESAIHFAFDPQPASRRDRIGVNATIPAIDAGDVPTVLARYDGCRTAKVKVAERGQTLNDDVARVAAVRDAMGPEGRVRIDANGGWNVDEAETALHALSAYDLEYAEQPCGSVEELAEIRRRLIDWDIPIAADESIRRAEDPLAVARAEAADLMVIKAQPLGGVRRALDIVERTGLPAVVSSAIDTSIGLAQGAHLAAALPTLDYDCGLGTASLLAADVTTTPLKPVDGYIPVARITPDGHLLDEHAASAERRAWWEARIRACHQELTSR
ncbi:o-succinylbenzoate synthase [Microbacterium amylolyticum]|uniref:o-succinylbenzoate synthase n=1 Tax=Microbacterium amylolyticum TaxID=936337 RepID=A0ABS4ZK14_9MICO|nr:o-succinylbenzoate synthase [Microbacterium amylolyticum]MBP2437348.1 O-succinylbenzoate synthase [Microbacterium amylolyticum]